MRWKRGEKSGWSDNEVSGQSSVTAMQAVIMRMGTKARGIMQACEAGRHQPLMAKQSISLRIFNNRGYEPWYFVLLSRGRFLTERSKSEEHKKGSVKIIYSVGK